MLTIVFGAGASFDSDPNSSSVDSNPPHNYEGRPPLARDLFAQRYANIGRGHPSALPIFSRLRRAAPNIEHELEVLSSESTLYSYIPKQLLSVRYYLHDVINNAQNHWGNVTQDNTTYLEFFDIVNRWQEKTGESVSLVTFNYDTLLDRALTSILGLNFPNVDSYVNNSTHFKLFKPHGSIDWVHKVEGVDPTREILDSAQTLSWTDTFLTEREGRPAGYYVPAIAVPTETKTTFEFPQHHLEQMKECIKETSLLLTIGWRGAEMHFLKLWQESNIPHSQIARIQIVNSQTSQAESIFRNISNNGNITSGQVEYFSGGFTKYVPEKLKVFLG